MSVVVEPSLSAQRCLLQQQLRVQRQEFILQLCESDTAAHEFPRSATMRFLSGRPGLKIVTELLLRQLGTRYSGVLAHGIKRQLAYFVNSME